MATITAVAIAALLQVANAYQHLVLYGKQGWENVEKVEFQVARGTAPGFDANEEFKEFKSVEWQPDSHDHFGYTMAVQSGDEVRIRLTQKGKEPIVVSEVIPKLAESEDTSKEYTEFGDVKLFSLRENVRHMGVWKDFDKSLSAQSDQGSAIKTILKETFEKVDQDHDGWHVLLLLDGVAGVEKATFEYTVGGNTKTTVKKIDDKSNALFGGWSVAGKKGVLKVDLHDGGAPTEVDLDQCVFKRMAIKVQGDDSANFIVMPFDTHAKFDNAWRTIMKGHQGSAPTHKYWQADSRRWISAALEELNNVNQGSIQTAGASETPLGDSKQLNGSVESSSSSNWPMIIIGCGVVSLLVAAMYFFCCATPDEKDSSRSPTSSSDSNEGFRSVAPSMHGEAWPVESVKVLVPPSHETEITGVAKPNDV